MADRPAYDASLADHGLEPREHKGLIFPLGDAVPDYGGHIALVDGIGWTRMPVPGALNHINLWLLDDADEHGPGVAVVDTGICLDDTIAGWEHLLANGLAGKRITRVIVTHFHPDHVGMAGWLCARLGVQLWMNRTEWLLAKMLRADRRDETPADIVQSRVACGWTAEQIAEIGKKGWGNFSKIVSDMPTGHVRLCDGDRLQIGGREWLIITTGGHTPEHVCLYDPLGRVVIAGDQILPQITSNVSVSQVEPLGNPMGEWLDGLARLRSIIAADTLVLPAHGPPFTGVHTRLEVLIAGHHARLDVLADALRNGPLRVVDCFALLFARSIDIETLPLATGEARAHLAHLVTQGRAAVDRRDGVDYFRGP